MTGDILQTTSPFPGVYHYGIIMEAPCCGVQVVHCSPTSRSVSGGNVVCEGIGSFLKDRRVVEVWRPDSEWRPTLEQVERWMRREWWPWANCFTFIRQAA